jgi:hypothetical protein
MVGCFDDGASEAGFTVIDAVTAEKITRYGTCLAEPHGRDLWKQVMLDVIVDTAKDKVAPA